MRWFLRRRNKRALVLRYIDTHGPCYLRDVMKGVRLNPGSVSWQLATAHADGYLTHIKDTEPDENGQERYRYDITYAGQLYLERAQ